MLEFGVSPLYLSMEDEMVNSETDLFALGNVDANLEKREATVLRPFHRSTYFYLFGQILDLLNFSTLEH